MFQLQRAKLRCVVGLIIASLFLPELTLGSCCCSIAACCQANSDSASTDASCCGNSPCSTSASQDTATAKAVENSACCSRPSLKTANDLDNASAAVRQSSLVPGSPGCQCGAACKCGQITTSNPSPVAIERTLSEAVSVSKELTFSAQLPGFVSPAPNNTIAQGILIGQRSDRTPDRGIQVTRLLL